MRKASTCSAGNREKPEWHQNRRPEKVDDQGGLDPTGLEKQHGPGQTQPRLNPAESRWPIVRRNADFNMAERRTATQLTKPRTKRINTPATQKSHHQLRV